MDDETVKKLTDIIRRSMKVSGITAKEQAFGERMWRKHPEEYVALHRRLKEEITREVNPWI